MENQQIGGVLEAPRSNDEVETFLRDDRNVEPSTPTLCNGIHSSCNSHQIPELVFCLSVCAAGLLVELIGLEPGHRVIPYQQLSNGEFVVNQMYDQEFTGETIGTLELLIYGIAVPFFLQFYFSPDPRYHATICVYFAAVGITLLATDAVKAYVGYLRPIFYDHCIPDEDYVTCTGDEAEEARRSFPSGHASISFCGLGLLSFYLEKRFGASKLRGVVAPVDAKSLAIARMWSVASKTPLILAGFIAASRLVDNMHHPADVVGGATLGLSVAYWIHNIWFEHHS